MFDELAELIFHIDRTVISRPYAMRHMPSALETYGSHDQTANRIQSTI